VRQVYEAERVAVPGATTLTSAVARNLHRLMAYKDEYEVARLSVDPAFARRMRDEFGPRVRWAHHLHPPILRTMGLRRKLVLGPAWRPVLRVLAAMRRLRGTPFDPFGHSAMRRLERRLVRGYRDDVLSAVGHLTGGNHALVMELAETPAVIRGYENVKLAGVAEYRRRVTRLLTAIGETPDVAAAVAKT
jgi:indolepyruvate ferredoxin oxidoreductase